MGFVSFFVAIVTFLAAIGSIIGIVTLFGYTQHLTGGIMLQLHNQQFQLIFYVIYVLIFFIALFGTYSAYKSHRRNLKRFSFLSFACAIMILCYIVYSNIDFEANARSKTRFVRNMTESMRLYNWDTPTNSSSAASQSATLLWDEIQWDGCCGLEDYTDWNQYRPKGLAASLFPKSCCFSPLNSTESRGSVCDLDVTGVRDKGCIERANDLWSLSFNFYMFYTVLFFTFSALAYLHAENQKIKNSPRATTSTRYTTVDAFEAMSPQNGNISM